MRSALAKLHKLDANSVSGFASDGLEGVFSTLQDEIAKELRRLEVQSLPAMPGAFAQFSRLPQDRQVAILDELLATWQIVSDLTMPTPNRGFSRKQEIDSLKRFLRRSGYRLANEDALDLIKDGDVFEIYNAERIQVFRSWSCFRVCSYSLVDLLVYDWNTLYDRPSWVAHELMSCVPKILAPDAPVYVYDLPEYLITERFEGHNNAFMFKMGFAAAIVDEATSKPVGLLTTGRATLTPHPKIGMNVSFI